jgi:hypothetical protein
LAFFGNDFVLFWEKLLVGFLIFALLLFVGNMLLGLANYFKHLAWVVVLGLEIASIFELTFSSIIANSF